MKTEVPTAGRMPAAIVQLASDDASPRSPVSSDEVARARAFAEPLLSPHLLDTGEPALDHADGVAALLLGIGAAPSMRMQEPEMKEAAGLHKNTKAPDTSASRPRRCKGIVLSSCMMVCFMGSG